MTLATTKPRMVSLNRLPRPGVIASLLALALLGPFFSPLIGIWGDSAKFVSVLWGIGAYGLVIGGQFYLVAALAVGALAAAALGRGKHLRVLSWVTAVLALLLAAGLPLFVLDFLQLRRLMDPAVFGPFKTAAFKVFAMAAIGIPILGFAAIQLRRAGKAIPPDSRPRGGPLVAGHQ